MFIFSTRTRKLNSIFPSHYSFTIHTHWCIHIINIIEWWINSCWFITFKFFSSKSGTTTFRRYVIFNYIYNFCYFIKNQATLLMINYVFICTNPLKIDFFDFGVRKNDRTLIFRHRAYLHYPLERFFWNLKCTVYPSPACT